MANIKMANFDLHLFNTQKKYTFLKYGKARDNKFSPIRRELLGNSRSI
jgi:hypothetical protein